MTLQLRDSITGDYASRRVWIQTNTKDYELLPRRSQELRNHSPDGFAWGYEGSGPAQFALALLLEAGMSDEEALSGLPGIQARGDLVHPAQELLASSLTRAGLDSGLPESRPSESASRPDANSR